MLASTVCFKRNSAVLEGFCTFLVEVLGAFSLPSCSNKTSRPVVVQMNELFHGFQSTTSRPRFAPCNFVKALIKSM